MKTICALLAAIATSLLLSIAAYGQPGAHVDTANVRVCPVDDPARMPLNRWRSHAHLLYGNWINQIYQSTPFDLNNIGQ